MRRAISIEVASWKMRRCLVCFSSANRGSIASSNARLPSLWRCSSSISVTMPWNVEGHDEPGSGAERVDRLFVDERHVDEHVRHGGGRDALDDAKAPDDEVGRPARHRQLEG
jgi:hypothetical protein